MISTARRFDRGFMELLTIYLVIALMLLFADLALSAVRADLATGRCIDGISRQP